ncbi:MAG: ATP phosphoribosyltransferase regulatory subunit [Pseudomonadota bacterium]
MTPLFADDALDEVAAGLRRAFNDPPAERVRTDTVQPLAPYVDFLGEFYRDTLVEYSVDGQDEFCLRPDLTLAIAARVAAGELAPGRYVYDDLVFRGARTASRRGDAGFAPLQRQVGLEIFGPGADVGEDAGLVLQVHGALAGLGLSGLHIRVSDVALITGVIDQFDLHPNWKRRLARTLSSQQAFTTALDAARRAPERASALSQALAAIPAEAAREAVTEVFAMSGIEPIGSRSLEDIADRMVAKSAEARAGLQARDAETLCDVLAIEGPFGEALDAIEARLGAAGKSDRLGSLRQFADTLEAGGIAPGQVSFDADLTRHISYYDGLIFEIFDESGEVFLGGGGRYDMLVESLSKGAVSHPALGAMLRPGAIAGLA